MTALIVGTFHTDAVLLSAHAGGTTLDEHGKNDGDLASDGCERKHAATKGLAGRSNDVFL
jgi:hypothetical protein